MLGRLEAALAVVQGLEHKVFGVTEADRQVLEPKLQHVTASLSDTIHTVIRMLPDGDKHVPRGN
jgi:hypothetical protein